VNSGPQVGLSCTAWPPTMAAISSTKPMTDTSPMRPGRM
jgi:hypothetical protein